MWLLMLIACADLRAHIIDMMSPKYELQELVVASTDRKLHKILEGIPEVTDIQFLPTRDGLALIVQKDGKLSLVNLATGGGVSLLAQIDVRTESEMGLLSVAIPMNFRQKGLIYLHLNPKDGARRTEVSEWLLDLEQKTLRKQRIVFQVEQPYGNHNGGQLQFGADGRLYLGLGDGGWRDDPLLTGQDTSDVFGSILRFDLSAEDFIPSDNPFVGISGRNPYVWVYGLRNPWKFSFLPDGRLIIADVGQNKYEEVSIASKGDNLGWNLKEAGHCFAKTPCEQEDLVDPIFEYDHSLGSSITGGYVMRDGSDLDGQYIFGDFITGRIWALDWQTGASKELLSSGINISTFGRDEKGQIFLADYGRGDIYRLGF